jgi:biopolymer transport protein ExbD
MALRLGGAAAADRYGLAQNADINVTPFVDVMLVLLIIFMVALPVATTSVKLELPQASASPVPVAPPTYVSLQADGRLFIGDAQTTMTRLGDDLAAAIHSPKPTAERVYIRADKAVRYEAFMAVMNHLKALGYERVGLVSEAV